MNIQVLVATMNQKDHSLIDKLNVRSDAIVANQCDRNEIEDFFYNGHHYKYLNFSEKGVGLNRNNALMRATADICVLSDDDMTFEENYVDLIEKSFLDHPGVDVIIFNLYEDPITRYVIKRPFKVSLFKCMRFGAARIAFRTESIRKNGIFFNLTFGGGTPFSSGEDTLFLHDCIKKKLKVIALPSYIATLNNDRESSWFKGYTDKFFIDKGALFACFSRRFSYLLCLQFAVRHRKSFFKNIKLLSACELMFQGIKLFSKKH